MRFLFLLCLLCTYCSVFGQFRFEGQVSEAYNNKTVYLSLIEDYRKTSRVYLDQIIQKTTADSLGHFSFTGEHLPAENHFYRIHTDGCDDKEANQYHFMGQCMSTVSVLFIANNRDTLALPLGSYEQEFCEIQSTNVSGTHLLEFESLKEKMILDFVEGKETQVAENLKFNQWFDTLHEFAKSTNEPLVELFIYSFLSERSNETYDSYREYLEKSNLPEELGLQLSERYPNSKYRTQFYEETIDDGESTMQQVQNSQTLGIKEFLPLLLIIALAILLFFFYNRRSGFSKINAGAALTAQEQKVVSAIKTGKTNKEIAAELFISLSTVKTHINSIYKKLGVSSRKELLTKV